MRKLIGAILGIPLLMIVWVIDAFWYIVGMAIIVIALSILF
jgi:hypothetical protein